MKHTKMLVLLMAVLMSAVTMKAQNCDPWIVKIYNQLYGRGPSAEECNIRNYNNGSWGSYDELTGYIKKYKGRSIQSVASTVSCDPWIAKAYKELYNREPSADECNIRNYNNGSWGSYNELVRYIKAFKGSVSLTISQQFDNLPKLEGDPWIFQAYKELYGREPNPWEANIQNYNGGTWGSYNELKSYAREFQESLKRQAVEMRYVQCLNGHFVVGFFVSGAQVGLNMVSAKGGNVVAAGGANVVAAGGANVVSAGGANVVSAGGANVVAAGGGNLTISRDMKAVAFGSKFRVASGGSSLITTSGKGAWVIQ